MAKLTALEKELRLLAAKNHHLTFALNATSASPCSSQQEEEDDEAAHVTATRETYAAAAAASSSSAGRTGSRFDILTTCVVEEGQMCSKFRLRQATRACHAAAAASPSSCVGRTSHNVTAQSEAADESGNNNIDDSTSGSKHMRTQTASPCSPSSSCPGQPQSLTQRTCEEVGKRCALRSNPPYTKLCAQPFSHLLICDFECTCAETDPDFPHEIIEFPVVVLDTATLRIVAEFHAYVRPLLRPTLTPFCTALTGITQAMVSSAETLPVVLQRFSAWLQTTLYPLCRQWRHAHTLRLNNKAIKSNTCALDEGDEDDDDSLHETHNAGKGPAEEAMVCFVTDGPSDMQRFMYKCGVLRDGVNFPALFYRYVDVRQCFAKCLNQRQVSLKEMLRRLGMRFAGKHHSGIDDARNIARVMAELLARGYRVGRVFTIPYCPLRGDKEQRRRLAAALQEKKEKRHGRHGPHRPSRRR